MNRIEELRNRLREAREAYYNLNPIISDQEFDALRDELSKLSPNDAEVIAVGAAVPRHSVWEKVKHEIPMGSLDKANSLEDMAAWAVKCSETSAINSWFVTHKIDGSSMELVYKKGVLIRCVTRGDGIVGEDVTENVRKILSIPSNLSTPIDVTVRGEVVMMKSVFEEKYSKEYANPRNTAAGKVREKKGGGEACKDLEFLAYWVNFDDAKNEKESMFSLFTWLRNHFKTPPCQETSVFSSISDMHQKTAEARNLISYEIDGLVISVNDLKILNELGELNGRPRGQIAWKFDAAMGETQVKDIRWQVGPTGRITPVAVVNPVEIGGVTITNVSLHNLDMFRELKLGEGSRVLIARRNDVIPYVERNLDNPQLRFSLSSLLVSSQVLGQVCC